MDSSSQTRVRSRFGRVRALVVAAIAVCSGCGASAQIPSPIMVRASERPALFLESGPRSAQIGYVSEGAVLEISGRARDGRVPVRIEGALRTRGFVDQRMLALRVQRRGRLRGTPLYVGPDDVVLITGSEGTRLRVRAQAQLRGEPFGTSYDGSYPREGLAARRAPPGAQGLDPGSAHTVPANTVVPLFELPRGQPSGELPARREPYTLQVLNRSEGWLAIRAGDGPYLIGWTSLALTPVALTEPTLPPPANDPVAAVNGLRLPARLANEPGALKRVAAGSEVVFGDAVIGVLTREGYARVVRSYDEAGFADVFVAADDDVALRGLVRAADLSEIATPEAAR